MQLETTSDLKFEEATTSWSAVYAMSLCVFVLIASEFLPVSLLSPLARDLMITEGQAGQSIAVSGIFAVITSLYIAVITQRINRRTVMLGLTLLMILSGVVVSFASNYIVLMVGRALLGIVIGGFWSLSTATLMNLLPAHDLPKGLAILNGGNALAATIAAPLGSFMTTYIGWRGAFFSVVILGVISFIWQLKSFPSMTSNNNKNISVNVFRLFGNGTFTVGMGAVFCLFMGQFALFTYLRPFLESVTVLDDTWLSLTLFILGITGFVGTFVVGKLLKRTLYPVLILWPCLMALLALGMIVSGHEKAETIALIGLWGFIGTSACIGWSVWLAKVMPDDTEQGGGLMVAVIQFAITLGASLGGRLYDHGGYQSCFMLSALILIAGGVLSFIVSRMRNL